MLDLFSIYKFKIWACKSKVLDCCKVYVSCKQKLFKLSVSYYYMTSSVLNFLLPSMP